MEHLETINAEGLGVNITCRRQQVLGRQLEAWHFACASVYCKDDHMELVMVERS